MLGLLTEAVNDNYCDKLKVFIPDLSSPPCHCEHWKYETYVEQEVVITYGDILKAQSSTQQYPSNETIKE